LSDESPRAAAQHVPVLVVGGGAAGLTAAILLARLGVEFLLVERHPSTSNLPKAHILNQRTMEIFREARFADRVYDQGAPRENMNKTAWYTSFAGPTPLHGRQVGYIDANGGGADSERYDAASPCRLTNLAQNHLEPLMLGYATELAPGRLRFERELVSVTQSHDRVTAILRDVVSGTESVMTCSYLIAADGGRTVSSLLDIEMIGERSLVNMVTVHLTADLSASLPDPGTAMFRFVNPDGPGQVHRGALVQMGGGGWGRDCREWVLNYSIGPNERNDLDADDVTAALRTMLGLPQLEVDIQRISTWAVEGVVADRFRDGRVFLVGDAAHRRPPAGGLGLNSAVQDVHNLAWKLSFVLRGLATELLLGTYQDERRPVDEFNTRHALSSFFQSQNIDHALGIGPQATSEQAWEALRAYFSGTPETEPLRARVAAAIDTKRNAYRALNVELGFRYQAGALVTEAEGAQRPRDGGRDPVTDYQPTSEAGCRVPHAWLLRATDRLSTIDLPLGRRFVLLLDAAGADAWEASINQAADEVVGLPLHVAVIGREYIDVDGAWATLRGVTKTGGVLVRPDGHVAWRSLSAPRESVLGQVLRRSLRLA
jgi:2,4-dichlorophenol 6-monooxygenase